MRSMAPPRSKIPAARTQDVAPTHKLDHAEDRRLNASWDLSRTSVSPIPAIGPLAIRPPQDAYEDEADRIAEQLMRAGALDLSRTATASALLGMQRKCACEGNCAQCMDKGLVESPKPNPLQRNPAAAGLAQPVIASRAVHEVLRSPGQPLDASTRAFMEPRFVHDFSHVRVHADPAAARSAREMQARAYTVGRDLVFAEGQFAPSTSEGKVLLAHELVHVLQQAGIRRTSLQRSPADAPRDKVHKPQIVKIVTFEQDEKFRGRSEGIAYVSYPANPDMAQEASTVPEVVTIKENKLKARNESAAGEYTLHLDNRAETYYSGGPGTFVWYNPWASQGSKESKYGWAETVHVTILPADIRSFLEKDRGASATGSDIASEYKAAEILVKSGITPEDLRREEHQANDYFLKPEEVDPVEWAQSLAEKKVGEERVALKNRQTFLVAAKRLSAIQGGYVRPVVKFMTDPDQANKQEAVMEILRGDKAPVYPYLPGTDFKDRNDLWATATTFSDTLDFELRALAAAVLNATESGILLADAKFTGLFNTTRGYGRLSDELDNLNKNPEVKNLARRIAYEEAHPPHIDLDTDLNDEEDDSTIHGIVRKAFPLTARYADLEQAKEEQNERIDSLKKTLNNTVNTHSNLLVAGLKGFDAYDFLPKKTEAVRSQLSDALAHGSRRIDEARRKLRDDSKFVYNADKVIDLEKAQLHVTGGSSLNAIIDGVVEARLGEKTLWESIAEIINILAALPIPPPAGPILRAIAAGINIGQSLDKAAAKDLAADNSLGKEKSSNADLALDIVITATGSLTDLGSVESHAAARASGEFSGLEGEARQEFAAGRRAEGEGASLAGEEREIEAGAQSLHLPPDPEAEQRVATQLRESLAEHPPTDKDIHGLPGQREAEFVPGHEVKEVRTPSGIRCQIFSDPPGIPTECPIGMGEAAFAAAAANHGPTQQLTTRLNGLINRLPSHVNLPQRNRLARILIAADQEGVTLGDDQFRQIAAAFGRTGDTEAAEQVFDTLEQSIETHLNVRDSFGENEAIGGGSRPGDLAAELPEGTQALNKVTKNPTQVANFLKRYPKVKASPESEAALDALYSHTRSGSAANSPRLGRFVPTETRPAAAELESLIELSERPDVVQIELIPSSYEGRTTDKIVDIRQPDGAIVRARYEDTTITGARTGYRPTGAGGKARAGGDRIERAVRGKISSTPQRPSQFDALMVEAPQGGTLAVHIQRPGAGGAQDVAVAMANLGPELSNTSVQAVEFYLPASNATARGAQPLRRQVLRYVRQADGRFTLLSP